MKFHDGTNFNAAAARASIERTMELKQGAYYIWAAVERIETPDEHTLVIRTCEPAPIDLIASSQYGAYMYSPAAAELGTEWFNQGNAAGTGPYHVRQWVQGQQVVLEKSSKGKVSKLSSSPSKPSKGASVASKPAAVCKKASRKQ